MPLSGNEGRDFAEFDSTCQKLLSAIWSIPFRVDVSDLGSARGNGCRGGQWCAYKGASALILGGDHETDRSNLLSHNGFKRRRTPAWTKEGDTIMNTVIDPWPLESCFRSFGGGTGGGTEGDIHASLMRGTGRASS